MDNLHLKNLNQDNLIPKKFKEIKTEIKKEIKKNEMLRKVQKLHRYTQTN